MDHSQPNLRPIHLSYTDVPARGAFMKLAWSFVLIFSFASSQRVAAQNKPAQPTDPNSCGAENAEFTVERDNTQPPPSEPESNKALVFVIDEYAGALEQAGMPTIRVGLDGAWVGANRGKSYIYFSVDPGGHRLCASGQRDSKGLAHQRTVAHFAAEAGRIYFFRVQTMNREGSEATLELHPLEPQEAKYLIADSDHAIFRPKK
jgi:hypothetical protein